MAGAEKVLPREVGVTEFRSNFAGFMRQVRDGLSFSLVSRGMVVAVVRPPEAAPGWRQPGGLRGRIEMADDFDAVPPVLLEEMEGGG